MTKRYQLGGTEWKYDRLDLYECDHVPFCLSEEQLLLMGATPIADKPEKIEPIFGMIGAVEDKDGRVAASDKMRDWMQQITKAVNSLKGEE
jgi:hypothetical protein